MLLNKKRIRHSDSKNILLLLWNWTINFFSITAGAGLREHLESSQDRPRCSSSSHSALASNRYENQIHNFFSLFRCSNFYRPYLPFWSTQALLAVSATSIFRWQPYTAHITCTANVLSPTMLQRISQMYHFCHVSQLCCLNSQLCCLNTRKFKKKLILDITKQRTFSLQTPFSSDKEIDNTLTNNEMKEIW